MEILLKIDLSEIRKDKTQIIFLWQEERVKPMHSSVSMDGKL